MSRFSSERGSVIRRSCCPLFLLVIFLGTSLQVCAQRDDKRVDEIRRLYEQVNAQIVESESVEEGTGIYCNELLVNKGDKPWPAVGIYRIVYKFYFTFGDREKNPYPNRLLKITVTTNRSNQQEDAEYLFNPAGQLVFYFENGNEEAPAERRYYFAANRLIRRVEGQRVVDSNSREAHAAARVAVSDSKRLAEVFVKTLGE